MTCEQLPVRETSHPISLYVHVPFCKRKCHYCDFYSETGADPAVLGSILAATIDQAELMLDCLGHPDIATMYIGGGTPNILESAALESFLSKFLQLSPITPHEITVEANPEALNLQFLALCTQLGVTRISLGIQSLQPELLSLLGRSAVRSDNILALEQVGRFWNGNLNLDLITGIPGQTISALVEDLGMITDIGPDHISLYPLTVESNTELWREVERGKVVPDDQSRQEDLWFRAADFLEYSGLQHYEISNFCRPGQECAHNLCYWNMNPYLGVGPGAVSTLPGRESTVVRIENPKDLALYLEPDWKMNIDRIGSLEFLAENIMMGLRLRSGISRNVFMHRFHAELTDFIGTEWNQWKHRDLVLESENYTLNQRGRMLLDNLLREIDLQRFAGTILLEWPE